VDTVETKPNPPAYREPTRLTKALIGLVCVQILAEIVALAGHAFGRALLVRETWEASQLELAVRLIDVSESVRMIGYLVAVVVFCFWIYRTYENLPTLGAQRTQFTPGRAVLAYFTPIANLVQGYVVMRDLWLHSQRPAVLPDGEVVPRRAPLVGWWWAAYLAQNGFAFLLRDVTAARSARSWITQSWAATGWLVLNFVAAALFLTIVHGIARRQHEQFDDLERQKPTPMRDDLLR
jgi:hypothetical protein